MKVNLYGNDILNKLIGIELLKNKMKSVSSGKTRGTHPRHRRKKKKKKYVKFPKSLEKQRKMVSEQSQDELEPIISTSINSPMSDE